MRGLRNWGRSTGGGTSGVDFQKLLVRVQAMVMVGIGGSSSGHGGLKNGMGSISDE